MKNVIIAAAPITKDRFAPTYASFPISDRMLLDCMGSQHSTDEILSAGCKFLGIADSAAYVTGLYYKFPERKSKTFEEFLYDLEMRYRIERRKAYEPEPRANNGRSIFQVLMQI